MVTDTHLMNIQVAILGVVIVIGMFYVWRTLARLESRVEALSRQLSLPFEMMSAAPMAPAAPPVPVTAFPRADAYEDESDQDVLGGAGMVQEGEDAYDLAEELMKNVFGGAAIFAASAPVAPAAPPQGNVIIEEEELPAPTPAPVAAPAKPVTVADLADLAGVAAAETESVVSVSTGLTKSKVKRMNLEELRALCREKNLSAEGTRAVLLDRVLGAL